MQGIDPGNPPHELVQAVGASAAFSNVSSSSAIRQALWDRQRGRCAYCERALRAPSRDDHRTRIEHFHPHKGKAWSADCARQSGVSTAEQAAVAWSNLLLCCDGNEHAGRDFTCDKLKHDTDICSNFVNPQRWTAGALVEVGSDGRVTARSGLPSRANHVIDMVLNLNAVELVKARKAVLAARRREIQKVKTKHQGLSLRRRLEMADRLREDAKRSEYGAVLISIAERLTS
jgi:uncharacterized protein (TIGR02646 family)